MNAIGFRTLLAKETRRFLKVPGQTLAQPVVTTTLYFLVFGFALGGRVREVDGVSYIRFIVPGMVLLTLSQNAFLNTSSSMFIAKMQGTIVDLLIAPLGVADLLAAFLAAAVLRGFLTGGLVWLISGLFTGFSVAHPIWVLLYMLLIATAFAAIGLAVAIWSDKFEQLNVVPTFVLTPLTFLGGVFYSARMLPKPWDSITRLNPILYMVEGLRFGFLGTSSSSPYLGLAITGAVAGTATILTTWMLATGYKLAAERPPGLLWRGMPLVCRLAPRQIATAALLFAMAIAPRADAAGKRTAPHAKSKAKAKAVAKECPAPKEEAPIVVAGGRVAMFTFTGDDAEPIRRQLTHLLKSKGMKIMTSLRPVDSAEQYREMSVTLNLVAYIDGEVTVDGNDGSATIYVRNGATGMRTASATVAAERHQLATNIGKELWERLGPALSQACADAAKPRKGGREPMRINAGTPLTAADTAEAVE